MDFTRLSRASLGFNFFKVLGLAYLNRCKGFGESVKNSSSVKNMIPKMVSLSVVILKNTVFIYSGVHKTRP